MNSRQSILKKQINAEKMEVYCAAFDEVFRGQVEPVGKITNCKMELEFFLDINTKPPESLDLLIVGRCKQLELWGEYVRRCFKDDISFEKFFTYISGTVDLIENLKELPNFVATGTAQTNVGLRLIYLDGVKFLFFLDKYEFSKSRGFQRIPDIMFSDINFVASRLIARK